MKPGAVRKKKKDPEGRFQSPFHKARIEVLQSLFAGEYLPGGPPPFTLTSTLPSQARLFRDRLGGAIREHRKEIDTVISRFSVDWTLDRMSRVDRNILRMGICEILFEPEVPFRVTVDESLELAHQFSEPEAVRFINGILHRVGTELNPEKALGSLEDGRPQPESGDKS
ncbi:transcription antitermination factor NusB [Leptospirillum ferriphilum]|uniref:Transcription antitermination protein NusB n=2 Tax=Leptospirillum ferriphilum TaxID=178606 RepID=A0A059XTV5_9BACT|nr:transcription antitermination factor NusB [Leptospirillum ferriphilum]AFS53528.1 transcription termination factor,NusB [Leptospirillum ferriphilum ML-04]AIA30525.1 nitrogen utilization protein B [Leptospirillum ferriphilum YSK]